MTADSVLTLRSAADIVAAVPYLIGFHPQDSLVAVAVRDTEVVFACRQDLPPPDGPRAEADAAHVASVVAGHRASAATVIGYGPPARVTPAVDRLVRALTNRGVDVEDILRVTDGRWWSYRCAGGGCCPAEGRTCDTSGPVAAAATVAGHVALPDRSALVARIAPAHGPDRAAMISATAAAERRLQALLSPSVPAAPPAARVALRRAGRAAVGQALRRAAGGGRPTPEETAWLGVLIAHVCVRDQAWRANDEEPWQVPLWTDVLRRVEPSYVPAPACLLAFAAWRAGHGALAAVAVERALAQDPAYTMAQLLDGILRHGLPPSVVDGWPVPAAPISRD